MGINEKSCKQRQIELPTVLTENGRGRTETTRNQGFFLREGEAPAEPNSLSGCCILRLGRSLALPGLVVLRAANGTNRHQFGAPVQDNTRWLPPSARVWMPRQVLSFVITAVQGTEQGCERWERQLTAEDCGSCGACCRHGFDFVQVSARDPFVSLHPQLVQLKDGTRIVPRPDGVCVALAGSGAADAPLRCQHYETRPKNCRDFEIAGDACLQARRRVGLSR